MASIFATSRENKNEEKLRHNKYLRWHIISHIHNSQVVEPFPKIVNYVHFKDFFKLVVRRFIIKFEIIRF